MMSLENLLADLSSALGLLIALDSPLMTPQAFALLIGLATGCLWLALTAGKRGTRVGQRLEHLAPRAVSPEEERMQQPFAQRVLLPLVKRVLRGVGTLAPAQWVSATEQHLARAGRPGGFSAPDFVGVRILASILLSGIGLWLLGERLPLPNAVLLAVGLGGIGLVLPGTWLSNRAEERQHEIERALPNALDMLTIGVEAGLAFESAMMRVEEQWDNALTREFRKAVLEMRVGTPREVALTRMAERADVPDLHTFVAVLVQSTRLGVSIARVLHSQAEIMRTKRRQRAEELARQAGVKMAFPLVFLILPAMFVIVLGPALPGLLKMFAN
jgi:tight adherence protein C